MRHCINPNCPKPKNNENEVLCQACRSSLLLQGDYWATQVLAERQVHGSLFSRVFKAASREGQKILKVLYDNDPWAVARFQREADILNRLQHSGLPRVQPDGFFPFTPKNSSEKVHCLVIEYIEGINLQQWMEERGNRPISKDEERIAIKWLQQLANILDHVHKQGFFHRDIKSSNIMLKPDGQLVLIDFGEVRGENTDTYQEKRNASEVTVVYSRGYTAPEQLDGMADMRSDFFSLGRTFTYLLTGTPPHDLEDRQTGMLTLRDKTDVSPWLADLIDSLMAPSPEYRPRDAQEILDRLDAGANNLPQSRSLLQSETHNLIENQQLEAAIIPKKTNNLNPKSSEDSTNKKTVKMAKKIIGLITILGIAGLAWVFFKSSNTKESPVSNTVEEPIASTCPQEFGDKISCGEEILFPGNALLEKQSGVGAFAAGKYKEAIRLLESAREKQPNDPETLIYLNNARLAEQKVEVYTIAVAAPLNTGENSVDNSGLEVLRGVAQAQNKINQVEKINGKGLRVAIADDADNPDQGKKIAKALTEQGDILGVVGHLSSGVSLQAAPVYAQGKLLLISPTSTSIELSKAGDFLFRTVSTDRESALALAGYLLTTARQGKVAVFYNSNSAYSRSLRNEFRARFPPTGEIVEEFDFSDPAFNAVRAVDKASREGATALVLLPNTSTRGEAREVVKANQGRYCIVAGDSFYNSETLTDIGSDAVDRLVVVTFWHPSNSPNPNFPQAAMQLWGGSVSHRTALAYDATRVLETALRYGSSQDRVSVRKKLAEPTFQATGATGEISFNPNGDRQQPIIELTTVVSSGGTPPYAFVPIDRASPLECDRPRPDRPL